MTTTPASSSTTTTLTTTTVSMTSTTSTTISASTGVTMSVVDVRQASDEPQGAAALVAPFEPMRETHPELGNFVRRVFRLPNYDGTSRLVNTPLVDEDAATDSEPESDNDDGPNQPDQHGLRYTSSSSPQ